MALKKNKRHRSGKIKEKRAGGVSELASSLAPLEEQTQQEIARQNGNNGVIVVDSSDLKFPDEFTERENEEPSFFGLEPVIIVILILSLAFIAFIAWQISLMPSLGKAIKQKENRNDKRRIITSYYEIN